MGDAGKHELPRQQAAVRSEFLPEFLDTFIHEIRNPLAPIRNATELLRSLCADDRQLQAVDIIERQVVSLTRLLEDASEATLARRKPLALMRQRVDFADIVEPALRTIRPLVEQQRQHLLVSLPQHPVHMNCDALRLSQVLQTLLDNAARHTPPGGAIALTIATSDSEIVIEVSDNGAGIAEERLPSVFNVFAQQSSALPGYQAGYNLAISRNIVEMHGGTITAESGGAGRGSRFVVRLPLQADAQSQLGARGNPQVKSRRILVIDDHADSAQSLAQVLACAGHSVVTATTGEQGLQLAEEFKPEAVVVDIGLPGLDGFDVAIRLRAHPHTQHALLIAVSGFSLKQFRDIDAYAVFRHYLLKPTSPYTLMYIIEHTLDDAERS